MPDDAGTRQPAIGAFAPWGTPARCGEILLGEQFGRKPARRAQHGGQLPGCVCPRPGPAERVRLVLPTAEYWLLQRANAPVSYSSIAFPAKACAKRSCIAM
jgi:hypothetical protein